ncbi:hypothetical protein [Paenibacillus sp. HJGM_3]|uniref:hypothetical protein n=1 Tax=Paenibacillus sp. HJGM_3 TaxID=3379816 RepID=UPI00385C0710
MYKFLGFVLLISYVAVMNALQTDEQRAMQAFFEGKRAVNRAAHAAAQQIDPLKLTEGIVSIDPLRAEAAALSYLRSNLKLDAAGEPLADSYWRAGMDVVVFDIVNETATFPYTYTNAAYGYSVTLNRPAVVLMIRLRYPRLFRVVSPIEWTVKGVAELVY